MNFVKVKKVLYVGLSFPALFFLVIFSLELLNQPEIKKLNIEEIKNVNLQSSKKANKDLNKSLMVSSEFDYKLIGYRAGLKDSSVILKKGNTEYVVSVGELLDKKYELINVSKDEVIFKSEEKLFKIENLVGK